MRGLVLAGGSGSRLFPLTNIVNKHLLPIYSKPMIFYPLMTLAKAGIKEVAIVVSGKNAGDFVELLKDGKEFGFDKITYLYQAEPNGIAGALLLAENFTQGENLTVILGDNTMSANITESIKEFDSGAHVFLKKVEDPKRYGVPTFSGLGSNRHISKITEKPENPDSDYAVIGLYILDFKCFDLIKKLKPSKRKELEIAELLNFYIEKKELKSSFIYGFWKDAGTFDSLYEANKYYFEKAQENKWQDLI